MLRTLLYGAFWLLYGAFWRGRNKANAEHSGVLMRTELEYYGTFWGGQNQGNTEHSGEARTRVIRSILGRRKPCYYGAFLVGQNQAYAGHSGVLVKPEPGYYGAF